MYNFDTNPNMSLRQHNKLTDSFRVFVDMSGSIAVKTGLRGSKGVSGFRASLFPGVYVAGRVTSQGGRASACVCRHATRDMRSATQPRVRMERRECECACV